MPEIKQTIQTNFKNTIIICGGFDKEKAEAAIQKGRANLVAFGRPFINNSYLVERMANDWPLSQELHVDTFYSADEKGYTDCPALKKEPLSA